MAVAAPWQLPDRTRPDVHHGRTVTPWLPAFAGILSAGTAASAASWLTSGEAVPGVPMPAEVLRWALAPGRALLEVSVAAALGLSLLSLLIGPGRSSSRDGGRVVARARRSGLVAAGVWLVASLMVLVLQTAELRPGTAVTAGMIVEYVGQFGAGAALLISAGLAVVFVVVSLIRSAPAGLLVPIAGSGLLPMVFAGHASSLSVRWHDLMLISLELHVLAATAWTGGLGAVIFLLGRRPALLSIALPRFSRLAALCLAGVATSGLGAAALRLAATPGIQLPDVLVHGGYGRLLLAKLTCLVVLAALGGYIRLRLLPAIGRGAPTAVVGWALAELAVMGTAFGLAVTLSHLPVV